MTSLRCFGTPLPGDLGLRRIANRAGLSVDLLPNGSLFGIGHDHGRGRTLISQIEGAALEGGIGRLVLRRRARTRLGRDGRARRPGRGRRRP